MSIYSSRYLQKGSAHVAIVIVIIVAILGVLGFLWWQNASKPSDDSAQTSTQETTSDIASSGILLTATSTIDNETMSVSYPEEWTLVTEGSTDQGGIMSTKLLSPDSKVAVKLEHSKGFYGDGACGNADAIVLFERTNVTSTDNLKVVTIIYTFPAYGLEGTEEYRPKDTYHMAGILRTNVLGKIEPGSSVCALNQGNLFDSNFMSFEYGKPAARASISLSSLSDESGKLNSGVGVTEVRQEMQSKSYRQAVEILASLAVSKE